MGCASSVHVSQRTDGVVYCSSDNAANTAKESRRNSSLQPIHVSKRLSTASLSISEVVSHIPSGHRESLTTEVRITHIQAGTKRDSLITTTTTTTQAWVSAEVKQTQTDLLGKGMDKGTKYELGLGPMKIYKHPTEILLVFGSKDAQSDAFEQAAKLGNYRCKMAYTAESSMEYYLKKLPELVIIDIRCTTYFNGETLCRNIRGTRPIVNTVIVGLTRKIEGDDVSILPLIKAGFDRRFVENHNVTTVFNELLMLDHGEVSSQCKLKATSCLFSAVENAYDAIEIQCVDTEKTEFQYVNPAYEKVTGYWRSEIVGNQKNNILSNCQVPSPESHDNISKQLSKGKAWEGVCIARKKGGERFVQSLKIVPIIGHAGRVTHYVVVKRDLSAVERDSQVQQMHQELQKVRMDSKNVERLNQQANTTVGTTSNNYVSVRAEAPITKVINMLNAAQDNSPVGVVQVLDRVIDILRTTELYMPSSLDQDEDKTQEGRDLVEGLMMNIRERRPSADSHVKGLSTNSSITKVCQPMKAPPEIQLALEGEDTWVFDIINLEKVSNSRPLFYLGQKIFTRFDVAGYLSVPDVVIRNWLELIEENYSAHNTYHNSTHAADVLHATSVFLQQDPVKNVLEHSDEVASLIAAVVHDVNHPGFTNSFLCNAGNELAILYNDLAVLESHHAAMAFKLTVRDSSSNIFKNLKQDEFKMIRQSIIDMVMATEMKQHFEHLAKFENSFNKRHNTHDDNQSTNGRGTPESVSSALTNFQSPDNRAIVRRMIIKCADIANPARPTELCREWAYRIAEEYFSQTEEEKKRGLPIVMPVFDRHTCNVPKSQIFFIDYFVMNLYVSWNKFAQVTQAMEFLQTNYEYWNGEAEKLEKDKESETPAITSS